MRQVQTKMLRMKNRVVAKFLMPSSAFSMAPQSLSSLSFSHLHTFHSPNPNPNPNPIPNPNPNLIHKFTFPILTHKFTIPPRYQSLISYSTTKTPNLPPPNPIPPPPEKKSFAVATGELFLGIAARLISRGVTEDGTQSGRIAMFERTSQLGFGGKKVVVAEESEVVWEQREEDVAAERERKVVTSPGFSFSAAGLLFPYHLGVAKLLIEKGYIKESTPLAGSSAGAIVCAVIASGSSMQDALTATKVLADDCRLNGTAFRLGAVLKDVLDKFLPDDAHIRSNGRVRVAVTQILWRPRGLLVDQFDSKEDLINAVITSSFIPGYLAPKPAIMFRNRLCIDGGLTLFMPPTSATKTVRICAFPASRMGLQGIGISPDCNPENRAGPRELLNWALEPAEDLVLDRLFELGYLDAAVWAENNPVEELLEDDSPSVENWSEK